jgi:hypothetical protein
MRRAVVDQGLFLIAFALYADAKLHSSEVSGAVTEPVSVRETPSRSLSLSIEMLRQELALMPIFRANLPGMGFTARAGGISIVLRGEELYPGDSEELGAVWHSPLESIGDAVHGHLDEDLFLTIVGYGGRTGEEGVGLGELRARWVKRFLEERFPRQGRAPSPAEGGVVLMDGGAPPAGGQMLELRVAPRLRE